MEDGIQHCEQKFLSVAISHGLCRARETVMSLEDTLRSQTNIPSMMLGKAVDYKQVADSLEEFMQVFSILCQAKLLVDAPFQTIYN